MCIRLRPIAVAVLVAALAGADDARTIEAELAGLSDQLNAPRRVVLLERLLELRRAGGDELDEAMVLADLVQARLWTRQLDEAQVEAGRAVVILTRTAGEADPRTAEALRLHATVLGRLGRDREAEPMMRRALALAPGESLPVAQGWDELGAILARLGDHDAAEEAYGRSVAIRRRACDAGDPSIARGLEGHANLLHRRGRYEQAEALLREALSIRVAAGERAPGIGPCRSALAATLVSRGALDEAIEQLDLALAALREHHGERHWLVADALALKGTIRGQRGDYAEAALLLADAIEIRRAVLGERHWLVAQATLRLVDVLRAQGDLEAAEARCREALAIELAVRGGDSRNAASALNRLGGIKRDAGDIDEALELTRQALDMRCRILDEDHPDVAASLNNLAELHAQLGELDRAGTLVRQAIEVYAATWGEDHPAVAAGLHNLAWLTAQRGDAGSIESARTLYERAAVIQRAAQSPALHRTCTELAVISDDPAAASALLDEAIAQIEALRPRAAGDETDRARFFGHLTAADPFAQMVRLQIAAGDPARALAYLERGRGRALLDLLARGADAPAARPRTAREIAAVLEPDELMLACDVGPRDVALLVVRPGGAVEGLMLDAPADWSRRSADVLAALVPADLRSELAAARRVIVAGGGPLAALCLEALPVDPGGDRLWIDAWPPIVRVPSGSVLADRRGAARSATPSLVAVGAPVADVALPASAREVDAIGGLVLAAGADPRDVTVLVGANATRANLRAATAGPRLLHVATHGLIEPGRRARDSALALTPGDADDDGRLRLGELVDGWGGRLAGTELVTLSACETARGPAERGEGVVALAWGFMHAGARNVVASLWKVDDAATALLMERFYANLLGADGPAMAPADALHEAKRWLRALTAAEARALGPAVTRGLTYDGTASGPKTARPYEAAFHWAGFVLVGSGN